MRVPRRLAHNAVFSPAAALLSEASKAPTSSSRGDRRGFILRLFIVQPPVMCNWPRDSSGVGGDDAALRRAEYSISCWCCAGRKAWQHKRTLNAHFCCCAPGAPRLARAAQCQNGIQIWAWRSRLSLRLSSLWHWAAWHLVGVH